MHTHGAFIVEESVNVDVEIRRTQGMVNNSVRYQHGYSINCNIYHMCLVISCMVNVVRIELPIARRFKGGNC